MKKASKFKKLSFLLIASMMVPLLAACGGNDKNSTADNDSGKEKIVYLQFSAGEKNAETLKKMVDKFEEENPDIEVEVQSLGFDDYFTALATKMAGNSAPDCFELNMENFLTYAIRDSIEPLDEYFEKTGESPEVYASGAINAAKYNDKIYAIPQSFSTVLLFYNKDLFDKAGVKYPTNEWKWQDEQEAAEKIRALGEDIWGTFQPITYNELYKTVKANDGALFSEDGKESTMNSQANIETLNMMMNRICGEDRVMPNMEDRAGRGDWDMFKSGNLGMVHTGIWAFSDFAENIKDFNWDVAMEPGEKTHATHFFANVACVNKGSQHKDAAFKFINFMGSNKDVVNMRLDAKWELPAVADESVMEQYISQTPPENREAVFESLKYSVAPPALLNYSEVVDIVDKSLESAVMNSENAKDVMDKLQEEMVSNNLVNP